MVVVTVGTLNHENALLLVPTAAFLLYDAEPRRVWLPVVAASLAGHLLARAAMQWLIPFQAHFDWRIWSNMTKPFLLPREMAYSLLALGGWYALGLMSLPACDKRLRRPSPAVPAAIWRDLRFRTIPRTSPVQCFHPGTDRGPAERLPANARRGTGRRSPSLASRLPACRRLQVQTDALECVG